MNHARRSHGFTLLEVLIAVAIFALIGIATHRLLLSAVRVDAQARQQEPQLRQLTRAMSALERDVEQAIERPVIGAGGGSEPAFWSDGDGQGLQWTRAGWSNPLGADRSQLQRVRWHYDGKVLTREFWTALDRTEDAPPQRQVALENIRALQWRFLDQQGIWRERWQGNAAAPLPRAVELRIEHARFGAVRRVLLLPDGAGGAAA